MFSNTTIALLFAIGFGAWVYARTQRSTGGNTKSALITASGSAGFAFVAIVIILGMIFRS